MKLNHLGALSVAIALSLWPAAAQPPTKAQSAAGYEKVRPERLRLPLPGRVAVTQFLAADSKGRTYLLRGDTLEVFRLRPAEGDLHSLGKLACRRPPEGLHAAAMAPSGSSWVVSPTGFDLATCDFVEEKRPAGWSGIISSLAYSRTSPLASVVPFGGGLDSAAPVDILKPRVFELEGGRWKPVFSAPFPQISKAPANGWMTQLKAETDTLLCADVKGSLWLASWNAYRVQKISAVSDKPEKELLVGSGKIEWEDLSASERQGIASSVKRSGLDPAKNQGGRARPQSVIRSILCGRGGLVYLVVSTGEGVALDRFDPSLGSLERILLAGVEVGSGPMTAALGAYDLVLGGRLIEDGLWRLSLTDLEAAHWKPVAGGSLNGKPLL